MSSRAPSPSADEPAAASISVAVITLNEAHHIESCLRSCDFADQRVVLDSGSQDATVTVARALGAQVSTSPDWPGFGRQKNRALALCDRDWVFSIDADEVVSDELRASIRRVLVADLAAKTAANTAANTAARGVAGEMTQGRGVPAELADGYWVTRSSSFCGRRVRFGDWRNDRVLRLFRRAAGRFSDDVVHERVLLDGIDDRPPRIGRLDGLLWHESVENYDVGRQKMLRYARLGADKLRARGKGGLVSAGLHASWTFIRGYLIRSGWLDGWRGLQIAWLNTQGTFLRYRWAGQTRLPPPPAPEGESR